ncbi:hypothetical protein A1O1_00464 [Capronia coronata CBS 617.96]|uniref:Zn(2)-C6 fungal-type domain-containing protein n=1 Tax=Capronia coronata CBS 617.96 TaxID=1182541 RepID=W9ZLJ5_9EURO|nr:uncharacterized protein A1O1_00464 [Capronia coronata CBS 617.96]EXJ95344.1 hypothetical protein A1O1_00464 [Capronia coronata CBS 617.96]
MPYGKHNPKRLQRTKRTKTFTGCWTCRLRGVKCDEGKPTCGRCNRAGLSCSGYGERLVWEDARERNQKGLQRRVMTNSWEGYRPILDEQEIDAVLETIDVVQTGEEFQAGVFAVFPASGCGKRPCWDRDDVGVSANADTESVSTTSSQATADLSLSLTAKWCESIPAEVERSFEASDFDEIDTLSPIELPVDDGLLECYPFPSAAPLFPPLQEGSQLMHHWVTVFSGLMIPTEHADNPFQTIYVPLALAAPEQTQLASGYTALLHAMYAVSAFHQARLRPVEQGFFAVGTNHHRLSLKYLHRSLTERPETQRQAILAAMIALHLIDMINGHSSSWRLHLRGARDWLQSLSRISWSSGRSSSTLYQLFLCIEALGPSIGGMTTSSRSVKVHPPTDVLAPDYTLDSFFGITSTDTSYCLDRLYGVTRPIFEVIVHINQLLKSGTFPSDSELNNIELKIVLNNPAFLRFPCATTTLEELTRHHASSFYNACYIYFKRTLRRAPLSTTQNLVRKSLEHLEAIERLENRGTGWGLIWPGFITACEARDQDLRHRAMRYFQRGTRLGMETFDSAARVVHEVWRRMETEDSTHLDWRVIMEELNIDLILV